MELNLPFGPWKEIASAEWNGVPTGFYVNPENIILLVAFSKGKTGEPTMPAQGGKDKEGKESQSVLLLMKKPLLVEGNAEKFLQNQKHDLSFIEKIIDKKQFKYLLLEAQPFFVEFKQEEMVRAVKEQYSEVQALAKVTSEVAENYECRARGLDKAEDDARENLLGDPVMLFAFSGSKTTRVFTALEEKKVILGSTASASGGKDGSGEEQVEISSSSLSTVFISGESRQARLRAIQVCVENMLISGIPCIVIGETDSLQGIAFPNKNPLELEKAGLPKPTGFALKAYSLGRGFAIDLRFVSPKSFTKMFFPSELEGLLESAWGESSLPALVQKLEGMEQKYAVAKALRVLKVLEKEFPSAFGENSIQELRNPWAEKAGTAVLLNAGPNEELQSLAVESVLNSLGEPPSEKAQIAFAIESEAARLPQETKNAIASLQDRVFFILSSRFASGEALEGTAPTLELELLNSGSAGERIETVASFSGEKKRMLLRPSFSSFEFNSKAV